VTSNSRASSSPLTFYAVYDGKFGTKIYRSWPAAQAATAGASKCVHKKFQTEAAARLFLAERGADGAVEIVDN
jgi:viroplasmin and RNaseH domain-containing protein